MDQLYKTENKSTNQNSKENKESTTPRQQNDQKQNTYQKKKYQQKVQKDNKEEEKNQDNVKPSYNQEATQQKFQVKQKAEDNENKKNQITSLSDIYKSKPASNKEENSSQAQFQKKQSGKSQNEDYQKNENYGSYNKHDKRPRVESLRPLDLKNKHKSTKKSTETGYVGSPDEWFDEDRYNRQKNSKANFDNANKLDYYFNSYSSHHIHEEMLKDRVRTLAYQAAIEKNPIDFKDKIVMDIGCGTGILSIFAARAGAKHVYAIDNAEIALFAREIVKQNGYENQITVFKGKVEEIDFPFKEGEVDIIISEWMGYFLLYESMLDCVLYARDRFLNKKTGKMLPDRAQMFCAAIEDSEFMGDKKAFWNDVYGVDMSIMTGGIFKDPMVDIVPPNNIMSDECCILDLDLVKMDKKEVEFSNFYQLKMNHNDFVHALVIWFDVQFLDLQNPVTLSTSPFEKYTHWKQSVVYLDRPLKVKRDEELYGSIAVRQDKVNFRELNIKISFHLQGQKTSKHFEQQYKFK